MPPWQLLAGKVLGIGLLGLGQLLLTALAASVSAAVAVDAVDVPRLEVGLVAWLLVWFLAGYALWSVVYGALGALASRPEDAQAVSAPATVVLMCSYFLSFTALYDPDSITSRIASLVPVTAPLVMPIRLARGQVAPWEAPLALVLAIITIYALVRLAGRIYAGGLLRIGGKVRVRDAWRLGAASPAAPVAPTRGDT
jgi:ABC-2 type transport system permease protein